MKVLITLLGLVSMACTCSDYRVDSIVSGVKYGYYEKAVLTTLELYRENRTDLIQEAIDEFFESSVRNFFNYVFRLQQDGGSLIVQQHFPDEVRRILDGKLVNLINKQDNLALTISTETDKLGNKKVFGDGSGSPSNTSAWRFSLNWENNNVYFKILGIEHSQYLKLAHDADLTGDRVAYSGSSPIENRYQWYLVPARFRGKNLFYIVNKEFNQALKLSRTVNRDQNRVVYGYDGDYLNPEKFGWFFNK